MHFSLPFFFLSLFFSSNDALQAAAVRCLVRRTLLDGASLQRCVCFVPEGIRSCCSSAGMF